LLDNHLGSDGLDITIAPPLPKKKWELLVSWTALSNSSCLVTRASSSAKSS